MAISRYIYRRGREIFIIRFESNDDERFETLTIHRMKSLS